jgi:hypothetical protein
MSLKERIARFGAARKRPPEQGPDGKARAAVNVPVVASFRTPGPKGYTDYPASRR